MNKENKVEQSLGYAISILEHRLQIENGVLKRLSDKYKEAKEIKKETVAILVRAIDILNDNNKA